jgi:hypothetical protein
VGLGAVVAIGSKQPELAGEGAASNEAGSGAVVDRPSWPAGPLECLELLGSSLVERTVERFAAIDVDCISVLVEPGTYLPPFRTAHENVTVEVVSDLDAAIVQKLREHAQRGIDHSFLNGADTYAETDLLDLFCFHRESRQTATPTYDKDGPLALWVVNCGKAQDLPVETLLAQAERASRYFIRGYVRRLRHPRDLRQIAADMLEGRCETGPYGRQVRPGVWHDQGAEVHRRARIVAPAYIGCGSQVRADALITRLSNIERDCTVDSGTVVEDSSILANTSVGICLDLCHAVVSGNHLFNLERDVLIEVADPDVIRSTVATQKPFASVIESGERPEKVPDSRKLPQIPEWQFDGNLIQE